MNSEGAARSAAEKYLKTLPPGWEISVWENIGWHWCLQRSCLSVSPFYEQVDSRPPMQFFCLIAPPDTTVGCGGPEWTPCGDNVHRHYGKTPAEAVLNAVQYMLESVTEKRAYLELAQANALEAAKGTVDVTVVAKDFVVVTAIKHKKKAQQPTLPGTAQEPGPYKERR